VATNLPSMARHLRETAGSNARLTRLRHAVEAGETACTELDWPVSDGCFTSLEFVTHFTLLNLYLTGRLRSNYIGCYKDAPSRAIRHRIRAHGSTVSQCFADCKHRGYFYFGLQDGRECFCGDSYARYGRAYSRDCNKKCKGDSREICGSGWRNSVYKTGMKGKFCECEFSTGLTNYCEQLMS
jgi:hypothetical protein